MRRRLLICLMVALSGLVFIASPALSDPGTLVYSWTSNVGPLNPHLYSPNQMFAQAMVYEPLVRYTMDGTLEPWLAESWEVSQDGRSYTVQLRKGVVFSDGTPFDAQAVKMNIDAVMANAKRHAWLELANQITQTEVVAPHTVRIELKDPYYPFLQDMALVRPFRFLSPASFPESGNTAEGIKKAVGTGPWVLVASKLGEYDLFHRNEHYWGTPPRMEKLLIKVIPDPNTRAVAFETGEVDLIYGDGQISLDTFDRFRNDPRYRTVISHPMSTRSLAINSGRGATRELAVRQAIQHAVDKDAIVKGVFLDTEIKADTLYSANIPYCDLGLPPYRYNPQEAEKILSEAGWNRDASNGARTKEGRILAVDLCFVGNDAVMKAVAEVLQSDLQQVGFKVNLLGEETDSFYKRQKSGEFDLIFNNTWGPPYEPHSFLSSWRIPSHADYKAQAGLPMKKEIDEAIGRVLVSTDEGIRQNTYREILSTINEQAVYLPLTYTTGLIVHRKELEAVSYGPTENEIPFEAMFRE
jgi:nickel transport system substrate-binding protein